jgi:hypothetical protein
MSMLPVLLPLQVRLVTVPLVIASADAGSAMVTLAVAVQECASLTVTV